jgi:serine O-acetyltransferase
VRVGADLRLPHATTGLVLHPSVRIGDRVTIFHNVTIGRSDVGDLADDFGGIVIEDDVVIGAGAVVMGRGPDPLVLGRGSMVGANAVVTHSVGPDEVWAGNPARLVSRRRAAVG